MLQSMVDVLIFLKPTSLLSNTMFPSFILVLILAGVQTNRATDDGRKSEASGGSHAPLVAASVGAID